MYHIFSSYVYGTPYGHLDEMFVELVENEDICQQTVSNATRRNRQLPTFNRTRGDVGVI